MVDGELAGPYWEIFLESASKPICCNARNVVCHRCQAYDYAFRCCWPPCICHCHGKPLGQTHAQNARGGS